MKKYSPLTLAFLLVSMILLLPCCSKDDDNDRISPGKYVGVPPGMPIYKHWRLAFILVDSNGNNIFPDNSSSNYPFDPVTFRAYSHWSDSIGVFVPSPAIGNFFNVEELKSNIENDLGFLTDTLFEIFLCFGQECDTIIVYPRVYFDNGKMKLFQSEPGMFRKLIWGNDTIFYNNITAFKKHRIF